MCHVYQALFWIWCIGKDLLLIGIDKRTAFRYSQVAEYHTADHLKLLSKVIMAYLGYNPFMVYRLRYGWKHSTVELHTSLKIF